MGKFLSPEYQAQLRLWILLGIGLLMLAPVACQAIQRSTKGMKDRSKLAGTILKVAGLVGMLFVAYRIGASPRPVATQSEPVEGPVNFTLDDGFKPKELSAEEKMRDWIMREFDIAHGEAVYNQRETARGRYREFASMFRSYRHADGMTRYYHWRCKLCDQNLGIARRGDDMLRRASN